MNNKIIENINITIDNFLLFIIRIFMVYIAGLILPFIIILQHKYKALKAIALILWTFILCRTSGIIIPIWNIYVVLTFKHKIALNNFLKRVVSIWIKLFVWEHNYVIKDKAYNKHIDYWLQGSNLITVKTDKTNIWFWDTETRRLINEITDIDNKPMNIPDFYTTDDRTSFGNHIVTTVAWIPYDTVNDYNRLNYNGEVYDIEDKQVSELFNKLWTASIYKSINIWYAHFSSGFDRKLILNSFLAILKMHGLTTKADKYVKLIMKGRKFYSIRIHWKDKVLIFKDRYLIINSPLRLFQKHFNLEVTKSTPREMGWKLYCLHDVLVLKLGFIRARATILKASRIDILNILTLPQLAAKCFKDSWGRREFKFFNRSSYWFTRQSFKGGRTQPFQKTGKDLNYHDFTRMYPRVMHDKSYPKGDIIRISSKLPQHIKLHWLKHNLGIWKISGIVKPLAITPFIRSIMYTRKRVDVIGTFFGGGKFSGIYTSVDINRAIKAKAFKEFTLHKGYIWLETYQPFKTFIAKYFEARLKAKKEGNILLDWFYKIVLNSAYGKFAQPPISYSQKIKNHNKLLKPINEDLSLFEEYKYFKFTSKNIGLATFVTAYARERLYDELKLIKPKDLYYCDTDRIVSKVKIIRDKGLGLLQYEQSYDEGIFLAPKNYLLKKDDIYHIRTKGFNRLRFAAEWLWNEAKNITPIYIVQELASWKNLKVKWTLNHRSWGKTWWRNPKMKVLSKDAPNEFKDFKWLKHKNNASKRLDAKYNSIKFMKNHPNYIKQSNMKLPYHK